MTLTQLQADFDQAKRFADTQHRRFTQAAAAEGRDLGPGEHQAIREALADATNAKAKLDRVKSNDAMTAEIERLTGDSSSMSATGVPGGSLGAQFWTTEAGQYIEATKNRRGGRWTSPVSDLAMHAAVLTEDSASGGPTIVQDHLGRIVMAPTRPLGIADLLGSAQTTSNAVVYSRETSSTAFEGYSAATVLEGGLKPESTMTFTPVTEVVRKIATYLPVSDEMLDDQPAIAGIINQRLRNAIALRLEDQIVNGSGIAPNLTGFLARAALSPTLARGALTNAEAIATMLFQIAAAIGQTPTGVVINAANWKTIALLKDADGNYVGSGPFAAPQSPRLWGMDVAISPAIPAGTALVVTKSLATIFYRGPIQVSVSNSHEDYFVRNLTAIRAEIRAASCLFVEASAGLVTGLN